MLMPGLSPPQAAAAATFARGVVARGVAHVVVGVDGPAMVASPTIAGRQVMLLWSEHDQAARWADVLVSEPRVEAIALADLLGLLLPDLEARGVLIGPDWSDDPADPQVEASALGITIADAAVDRFCAEAALRGHVYVLTGPDGMAGAASADATAAAVLPLWNDRAQALDFAAGPWDGYVPHRLTLADLGQRTLLWCVENGWRVAPGFGSGLGELRAGDLKARLRGAAAAARSPHAPVAA